MSSFKNGDSYIIMNVKSRTVVDLSGGESGNGIPVVGWSQHMNPGLLNQIWKVEFTEKDSNDYQWCKFINRASGTILDLKNGEAKDGTPIQGWANNPSSNSQWLVWPVPNRSLPVHIIYNRSASSDKVWYCADLHNGESKDNTKVQIMRADKPGSNEPQVWMLIKVN